MGRSERVPAWRGCGRRCPAIGKRPADPGGTLGCSSGEIGYEEASIGWRDHETGDSLLAGRSAWKAGRRGFGNPGKMQTPRGSAGVVCAAAGGVEWGEAGGEEGRDRCACAVGALGRRAAGIE